MADQGPDTNPIPARIVDEIKTGEAKTVTTEVVKAHVYEGVSEEVCVKCTRKVALNFYILNTHGTSFLLKNIVWKISGEDISLAIWGRGAL